MIDVIEKRDFNENEISAGKYYEHTPKIWRSDLSRTIRLLFSPDTVRNVKAIKTIYIIYVSRGLFFGQFVVFFPLRSYTR